MRRLFLLRHAKTETHALSARDRDRRLEERGHNDAALIGQWLSAHPPLPDYVYVSTATRTRETWGIVASKLGKTVPHTFLDEIYSADVADLLKIIRMAAIDDPDSLMIIGHNPALHELILDLLSARPTQETLRDNLPTGGLVAMDLPVDDWSEITPRSGRLVHYITPKLLKTGHY